MWIKLYKVLEIRATQSQSANLWKSDIHRPSVDIRLPQDYYNDSADELDELWLDDNSEEELASDGDWEDEDIELDDSEDELDEPESTSDVDSAELDELDPTDDEDEASELWLDELVASDELDELIASDEVDEVELELNELDDWALDPTDDEDEELELDELSPEPEPTCDVAWAWAPPNTVLNCSSVTQTEPTQSFSVFTSLTARVPFSSRLQLAEPMILRTFIMSLPSISRR